MSFEEAYSGIQWLSNQDTTWTLSRVNGIRWSAGNTSPADVKPISGPIHSQKVRHMPCHLIPKKSPSAFRSSISKTDECSLMLAQHVLVGLWSPSEKGAKSREHSDHVTCIFREPLNYGVHVERHLTRHLVSRGHVHNTTVLSSTYQSLSGHFTAVGLWWSTQSRHTKTMPPSMLPTAARGRRQPMFLPIHVKWPS